MGYLGDDTVVTLGCGGSIFVQFVDADGEVIALRSGDEVVVAEYGPRCSQGGVAGDGADRYGVRLCTDLDEAALGNDASCSDVEDDLQGFTSVPLP